MVEVLSKAVVVGALALVHAPAWCDDTTGSETATVEKVVISGASQRAPYRVETTSSATRTETPLQELPQSVQVLSRQQIDDVGATRLEHVLLYVSGVAKQNDFGGIWDNYSIRGFSGNENGGMNILWNGFAANRGYAPPRDMANVESVDFLKGPAAALYGNSEPGGTINVATKKPQFRTARSLDLSAGSHDAWRAAADFTGALGDTVTYRVNGAVERKGSMRDHVRSRRTFLAPALAWVVSERTTVAYEGEFLRQKAPMDRGVVAIDGDPGALPVTRFLGEPGDGDIAMVNQNHLLTMEHRLAAGWRLRTGVFHKQGNLDGYSTEASSLRADNATVWRQRRYRDFAWRDTSLQADINGRFHAAGIDHEVLAGIEAGRLALDQRMLRINPGSAAPHAIDAFDPVYGQAPPVPLPNTDTGEYQRSAGLYLQDQVNLSERWKVLAGVRADRFRATLDNRRTGTTTRQHDSAYSPRLGVTRILSPALAAYGSWSKSFRPNTGSDVNANAFGPETARAQELGVKWQGVDGRAGATLAVFDITKRNVLTADPANPGYSIAAGAVRSQGVELDFSGRVLRQWRVTGNVAALDARVESDNTLAPGTRLVNVPRASASLLAVYDGADRAGAPFGAGAGFNYVGTRTGDQAGSFELPSYVTARALAYWQLSPTVKLSLDADNLFDRRHYASSYNSLWVMPGTGRSARLALHVKL